MDEPVPPTRQRDAARTREAILDAAERLFAEQGYDAASLEEIGRLAGVSRGTPRYFFGAKQALYRAVLARVLTAEADLLLVAQARATAAGGGPEELLTAVVESFLDFLVARPSFVQLVEREATAGGATLREVAAETPAVQAGLATLGQSLADPAFHGADPAHILLSLLALCWFPLAHADTFTRSLGIDPEAAAFLPTWKRHVVALALHGLRAP
jgi:TetR/AcrR family transcriptional regulator